VAQEGPTDNRAIDGKSKALRMTGSSCVKRPALPERAAILHRGEQRIVEAMHGNAAARRRGMH
jgi:hypothetical protein